jgi:hypothetical protein
MIRLMACSNNQYKCYAINDRSLSIDGNGIVTVAANTRGKYSITYELCEANPSTDYVSIKL